MVADSEIMGGWYGVYRRRDPARESKTAVQQEKWDRLYAITSDCYVGITVDAYFQIPKSYTKGKRLACQHNINRPAKKPDIDNTLKVVLDALNKAAYEDDKQVVEVSCRKWYSRSAGYLRISVREVKQ